MKTVTFTSDCPSDVDGIVSEVRRILLLGSIQSVKLSLGRPITYTRVQADETPPPQDPAESFAELSLLDVVRNTRLEEYSGTEKVPAERLLRMYTTLSAKGWVVNYLLVSPSTQFWAWLGIDPLLAERMHELCGARIELDDKLPSDVFILCGSRTREALISDVAYSLKSNTGDVE